MEKIPHRDRERDWWVIGRLGGAIRYDRSIRMLLWMRPSPRSGSKVNMLGPQPSESMDQVHAPARKKVRLEGIGNLLGLTTPAKEQFSGSSQVDLQSRLHPSCAHGAS